MTYTLPEPVFQVAEVARNLVLGANQFRDSLVQKDKSSYEEFWALDRRTVVEQQAVMDLLGMVGLQILQDSAGFVTFLETAYAGSLEVKYHSTPYIYELTPEYRVVLGGLKEDWIPEEEEEVTP